jgi:hypothetical protein
MVLHFMVALAASFVSMVLHRMPTSAAKKPRSIVEVATNQAIC